MESAWNTGGRRASVGARLEEELRRRLVAGLMKPGDRLPSAVELGRVLSAHPITVQKALRDLKGRGLLDRIPRLGTFIRAGADQFRVAVLFGPHLTDEGTYFYRAILAALRREKPHPRWQCFSYDGLNGTDGEPLEAVPAGRHFLGDLEREGYRGIMGIGLAHPRWAEVAEMAAGLPLIRMGQGCEVDTDFRHFGLSAARALLDQGCRAIHYLRTLGVPGAHDVAGVREALSGRGGALRIVQFPPRASHYDEARDAAFCRRLARRWAGGGERPDGVMISDDVTMRSLALALLGEGPAAKRRFPIVTWANRGIRFHYGIPALSYEVDPGAFSAILTKRLWNRVANPEGEPDRAAPVLVRGRIVDDDGASRRVHENR